MPLPPGQTNLFYVDKDKNIHNGTIQKKDSGYRPTKQYYPTMKVVRCGKCGSVGVAEFVNGFNIKEGDRLMDNKSIRGTCFHCRTQVDLVPVVLTEADKKEYGLLYGIMRTMEAAATEGKPMNPEGIVVPIERIKAYERAREQQQPT